MSSSLEFEAKAVDKAVRKASETLNIPEEELKYSVISYGSSGIFGLVGVKKAKICVTLPDKRKDGSANRNRNGKARKSGKNVPAPHISEEESQDDIVSSLVQEAFGLSAEDKPEPNVAESVPEDAATEDSVPEDAAAGDTVSGNVVADEGLVQLGKEALQRIIDFITTDATVQVEQRDDRIRFNVEGGNAGILIGKRGQTLEAIQYLVEKIVNKSNGQRVRIQVDVEGYLDNRKANLESLAKRFAEKTGSSGKPSTMGPMNAHDRRIVHLALKDDNRVRTQSVGEGFYRKLVIFPKKKKRST
ncbi:RNA-binding protein [Desulfonema ishimotonii]|uniref:RNA-binding protein KhpB n=1 Tax=Desulfonema ishimotonii TaxID=45657 RepID=A0A401G3I2_9BACT|nr:RNA-binding cell elongation regulator Jag/EloR [Desulfonema ishimotonii]GBC63802.1 RNA-binding protein [Desulfonema ishimotonii]